MPGGWVSLDESDNNLYVFASYLLAAIEAALPQASLRTKALLSSPALVSPTTLAHNLLADLDEVEKPFLLILDDIHNIREQGIFTFLEVLLNHPSPVLYLVLVGRQDPPLPVASWRAYGQITEIRMRDLRFTPPETALFLSKMLKRAISESMADEWTAKTEGWIVALRLAALSLRYHPQLDVLVPGDNLFLQEYLLSEVLAQQPASLRSSLLKTALLDRFCASLCEAVCSELQEGSSLGMNGEQYIEWLRQSNLFLIDLDRHNEWFRFHHLFQSDLLHMLGKQLNRQEIAGLRLKASRWFAENGLVSEAIRHALAANDPRTAVEVFAASRRSAMNREDWRQLEQWIGLFPEEVVQNDPLLLLTTAHLPLTYGHELEPLLRQAGRLLAELPPDLPRTQELRAEISYFGALGALLEGTADTAISIGASIRETLPSDAYYLRSQALGAEAFGHQMSGNLQQGVEIIQGAFRSGAWPVNLQVKAFFNQALLYFMEAALAATQTLADKSIELALRHNLDSFDARCFAGMASYLQNDLPSAEAYLLPVIADPAWVDPVIFTHSASTLMRVYYAQGSRDKAEAILQKTRAYLEEIESTFSQQLFDMFQVELALNQGDIAQAHQLSLPLSVDLQLPFWFWHYFTPQLTPIKLWVAEGKELERALALLEKTDEFLRKMNRNIHRIDVLALQALAYKSLGNWPKALEKLDQSVVLAAQGEFIRNYLDLGPPLRVLLAELYEGTAFVGKIDQPYVARILAAYSVENSKDGQSASLVSSSIDPLTEREQEVLSLLATDLSTKEIAEEMNVTWSTVRTHIKHLYSKLGVHGRYEAVQHASENDLL